MAYKISGKNREREERVMRGWKEDPEKNHHNKTKHRAKGIKCGEHESERTTDR